MRPILTTALCNIVLAALAFVIAGFGHGFSAGLVLLAAPWPPQFMVAAFAAPLLWAGLCATTTARSRWLFPATVTTVYVGAIIGQYLNFTDDFLDAYRNTSMLLHQFAPWMTVLILLYLLEQWFLWKRWHRYPADQAKKRRLH